MSRIPALDWQPGLVAIDTVAHCGNSAKGQYAFTLTVTDVFSGWTINRAIKNKAAKWVVAAMEEIQDEFPYPIDHVHSTTVRNSSTTPSPRGAMPTTFT